MSPTEPAFLDQLKKHNQAHLVEHLASLPHPQASALADQLAQLDLEGLHLSFEKTKLSASAPVKDVITPVPTVSKSQIEADGWVWKRQGYRAIANGQVAAVCLAGGQGTRLGFDGPKGAFDAGLPSGKSLFQMHAERLLRLSRLAGPQAVIPFYVMTSPLNDAETRQYFEDRKYFGLNPANVMFFTQGTLPCLEEDGKIMLETAQKIASAPDGNGGVYIALSKSGALDDMDRRGVTCMHVYAVDNPLACPGDALFVGCCLSKKVETGNMCVPKSGWDERVGVAALRNGNFHVVEYSEISEAMAKETDADGKLVFGSANICSHFFTLAFIRDVVVPGMRLQHHVARKAIPFLRDPNPTKPNGIKLELFIFDAMPLAKSFVALEVDRQGVFAPIKNATGADSPATARAAVTQMCLDWLIKAGAAVEGEGNVEISPLLSLEGEGLDFLAGKTVRRPCEISTLENTPVAALGADDRLIVLKIANNNNGRPAGMFSYQVVSKTASKIQGDVVRARLEKVDIARTTPVEALFILQELLELARI